MTGVAFEQIKKEVEREYLGKKDQWVSEAKSEAELENSQEMILEALSERFGTVSNSLINRIKTIDSQESLKMLFKQCFRMNSLEEFEKQVHKAMDN